MVTREKYYKLILKYLSNLGIFSNVLTIALAILYFFLPANFILYDVFGIVLILSWTLNLALIYLIDKFLNKNVPIGKRINRLSYYYIALSIGSILLMVFGVILSAFIISGFILVLGNVMIILGFLIITLYGINFSIVTFTNINTRGVWKFE